MAKISDIITKGIIDEDNVFCIVEKEKIQKEFTELKQQETFKIALINDENIVITDKFIDFLDENKDVIITISREYFEKMEKIVKLFSNKKSFYKFYYKKSFPVICENDDYLGIIAPYTKND